MAGCLFRRFEYACRVIRLRESIQAGLRHPILGPLVLLLLGLLLAFVILHAVEDGIAGELFACVFAAVVVIRLLARPPRVLARVSLAFTATDRAPPWRFFGSVVAYSPSAALLSTPLRR